MIDFGVALGATRLALTFGQQMARDILFANKLPGAEEVLARRLLTHLEADTFVDWAVETLIEQVTDLDTISIAALLSSSRSGQDNAATNPAHLVTSIVHPLCTSTSTSIERQL